MVLIDTTLVNEIVDFCYQESDLWEFGYSEDYDSDNVINRGRKLVETYRTPFDTGVLKVEQDILNQLGVDHSMMRPCIPDEDVLPHFVNCLFKIEQNSIGIQRHTDPRDSNGWLHMRVNYMLQKPTDGGEPVINRKILPVKQGQSWNCWASEHVHFALPVKQDPFRISLSLGFYVAPEHVNTVKQRIESVVDITCN